VAEAYLYLRSSRQAAEYYRLVLTQHPEEPFESKGLFYQVELRQWSSADAALKQMEDYLRNRQEALQGKYPPWPSQRFEYESNEALRLRAFPALSG
jgi:hypothetical protein